MFRVASPDAFSRVGGFSTSGIQTLLRGPYRAMSLYWSILGVWSRQSGRRHDAQESRRVLPIWEEHLPDRHYEGLTYSTADSLRTSYKPPTVTRDWFQGPSITARNACQ